MRFLIADDHGVVRHGVQQMLADEFPDAEFGEAADCGAVLQLALDEDWDLVILDLNMPGRGGIDTLVEIKKAKPDTPVLVLSMFSESEYAVRVIKAGAASFINKGSVTRELIEAVHQVLETGRYITPALGGLLAAAVSQDFDSQPHDLLSNREYEVMRLIATGHTVKMIAAKLALSEKTVFTYRSRMLEKLQLEGDVEVARYALRQGLVE